MMQLEQEILRLLHGLLYQVKWQEGKLQEMHQLIKRLDEEISAMRQQRGTRIDKVEYNFDQLKVEKLEGTLNIGLTPAEQGEIGQMAVEGELQPQVESTITTPGMTPQPGMMAPVAGMPPQPGAAVPGSGQQSGPYSAVSREAFEYVDEEVPVLITGMEQQYGITLDGAYRQRMIDDIRRQMSARIQAYIQRHKASQNEGIDEELSEYVMNRVKRDVEEGVRLHFEKIFQQREGRG